MFRTNLGGNDVYYLLFLVGPKNTFFLRAAKVTHCLATSSGIGREVLRRKIQI